MAQPLSLQDGPKALDGVRVLDLTSVIMGPVCTQILGGYGAQVVKIEPPEGDIMRHAGAQCAPGMGAMFVHANHYKKSVVIDLKSEQGRDLLWQMIPEYDVFVHNIRRDAMERLGLGYEALRAARPDVVYVALGGYSDDGPYAGRPAYDDIIQAQAGLASLYARQTGNEPAYVPSLIVDRLTGIAAAHRVLAALLRRHACGTGEYINVSMFETLAELVLSDHLGGKTLDPDGGDTGYSRLLTRHRRPYRTRDGYIAAVVYNDKHWKAFLDLAGEPEKLADDRYGSAAGRARNYDVVYEYLADTFQGGTTNYWIAALTRAQIPCARVNDVATLAADPQLRATGLLRAYTHDSLGVSLQAINKNAAHPDYSPPEKGAHTVQVLAGHGLAQPAIDALLANQVVHDGRRQWVLEK